MERVVRESWGRVEIVAESAASLADYGRVPTAFAVNHVADVEPDRSEAGDFVLSERELPIPTVKDYDADEGNRPADWAHRFDVTNWGFLSARIDGKRVGGAVVAFQSPDLDMLEGRNDLAVLWDIRVAPDARGNGIGSALIAAAEEWARGRGARLLKVETQNINVPACHFYAGHGFRLDSVDPAAYADHPDEVQLLWTKSL